MLHNYLVYWQKLQLKQTRLCSQNHCLGSGTPKTIVCKCSSFFSCEMFHQVHKCTLKLYHGKKKPYINMIQKHHCFSGPELIKNGLRRSGKLTCGNSRCFTQIEVEKKPLAENRMYNISRNKISANVFYININETQKSWKRMKERIKL